MDTKLAKQIKPSVVHQLSLYNRMLAEVQGVDRRYAHVVLGTGEIETIDLSRYAPGRWAVAVISWSPAAVAEGVVDVLEVVEVDEQHRHRPGLAVRRGQRVIEPVVNSLRFGRRVSESCSDCSSLSRHATMLATLAASTKDAVDHRPSDRVVDRGLVVVHLVGRRRSRAPRGGATT